MVFGYPSDDVLETLRRNYAEAVRHKGVGEFEHWVRDVWYVSLVHFGAVLAEPAAFVAWCDRLRDRSFGVAELPAVELLRWHWSGERVRPGVLYRAGLRAQPS